MKLLPNGRDPNHMKNTFFFTSDTPDWAGFVIFLFFICLLNLRSLYTYKYHDLTMFHITQYNLDIRVFIVFQRTSQQWTVSLTMMNANCTVRQLIYTTEKFFEGSIFKSIRQVDMCSQESLKFIVTCEGAHTHPKEKLTKGGRSVTQTVKQGK